MKNFILFIFISTLSSLGFSQTLTPEFEFQFYFEDASGNKDTVTLGYDALATGDVINTDFGEENILNEPWSDGLDVRIGNLVYHNNEWGTTNNTPPLYNFNNSIQENTYLAKKKIVEHVCDLQFENASRRVSIQMTSDNFPVTISWDKTPFENSDCINFSMLYGVSDHMQIDVGGNFLLEMKDSVKVLGNSTINDGEIIPSYVSPDDPLKTIYVVQFNFVNNNTLSVDKNEKAYKQTRIYPNPISTNGQLFIESEGDFQIFNELGQIKQTGKIYNNTITLNVKESGLYILKIIPKNIYSNSITYKLIVE